MALAAEVVNSRNVWFDVDLAPLAGQSGELRLETEAVNGLPTGYWLQPQLLAQADWLYDELPSGAITAGHRLGDGVTLAGYAVEVVTDDTVLVTLYWWTERPLTENATVFVHGLDDSGQMIAQHDGQPVGGSYPLSVWPTGVFIADEHLLTISEGLASKIKQLAVGLYDPTTFSRWPVITPDGTSVPDARFPVEVSP